MPRRPPAIRPIPSSSPTPHTLGAPVNRSPFLAAAGASALLLTACSAGPTNEEPPAEGPGRDDAGVGDHAFGSTKIPADTNDIVTLGWGSTEAALALGVVPVGIEAQTYAVDDNGLLPWVNEELESLGAEPTVLPATVEEPAYEDIDALQPDLILAPYSGITAEQYELLSQIAPTVVFPEEPWTTPWREVIEIVGTSLDLSAGADVLLADLDAYYAAGVEHYPVLHASSVAPFWNV